MLNIARKRAEKLSMNVSFLLTDAEALPFSDETFDTVVSSLSTCTFPNPAAALKECNEFVEQRERSCCWSMDAATANGLDVGRIGMQINLLSRLAVTGTASRLSLLKGRA
jgi:ubiquinone/menaquinone biosynthesis C-methylase UbiE